RWERWQSRRAELCVKHRCTEIKRPAMRLGQELAVVIDVDLLLPNLALRLALELFGLALELLARVAPDAANRIAYAALDLVGHAFALILQSIPRKIVRHDDPPGTSRWRLTRGDPSPLTRGRTARHMPLINMCLSCRGLAPIYHEIYRTSRVQDISLVYREE